MGLKRDTVPPEMIKKLKWIGIAVLAVLVIAGLAAAVFFGNGTVTVIAPEDSAVVVKNGDKELGKIEAGGYEEFKLEQGKHSIELAPAEGKPKTYEVNVENGMYDDVLPLPGQCFALLDVTNYWYEETRLLDKISDEVSVEERFDDKGPFDAPAGAFYDPDETPDQIKEDKRIEVLFRVDCEALALDDDKLVHEVLGETEDD